MNKINPQITIMKNLMKMYPSDFPYFGYDTETTGLAANDKAFGFSISTPGGKVDYVDVRRNPKKIDQLNDQLRNYNGKIICHNASYDYRMSRNAGINLPIQCLDDTVIRACQINEHLVSYELDKLVNKYLGKKKEIDIWHELAEIFGGPAARKSQIKNIQHAPPEVVAVYCNGDAELTRLLWEWQEEEIERQGIREICDFERGLMPTFIRAEMRGVRTDLDYAEEAADKITPIIEQKQKELDKRAGVKVNANSPLQVKKLFNPKQMGDGTWVASDGTPLESTPKGQASLGADALREINDPMAGLVLEIRSLIKTRDTFLRGHVIGNAIDGRVFPTINQNKGEDGGTGTGRLSYQTPALQQIPSRNKQVAAIVKPCFLPDEGYVWVDADEASFEVRVFAHLVNNPEIIQLYKNDPTIDFHQMVSELTGLVRNAEYSGQPNAKQLNLSMIFNSGKGAIADKMGMPWEWNEFTVKYGKDAGKVVRYKKAGPEAERVIASYHRRLPGIKELAEGCKKKAERRGYIFTSRGRRLRFPKGFKSYKASGLLIQATAADINKENWAIIEEQLDGVGHLILNTHDSYSMCMPEDWEPHYKRVEAALNRDRLRVPLVLELSGVGKNWWDAVKKEE